MKLKRDKKFGEELTCCFKIGIRNLTNFHPSTLKSQNFHFNGLLRSKVYIVWAKKVQRSNLSWNWRGIQNLERNRLVVSKLPSGIWQILTRALECLKNLCFSGLLLSKLYIVWAKKEQRNNLWWNWRGRQTLERNRRFKLGIRNSTNFDPSTRKSQKFSF